MSNVDQIKSRLDIADVISSYIKLEKTGGNFKACCPFHNEKTPSFYVSPGKGVWHCFGCAKGGDIISFVMEIEHIEFLEALKILAKRAGVELKNENPKERNEKNRLLDLIEDAKNFYKSELFKNNNVLNYLIKERGLVDEIIKEFEIGFAPDGWRNIYDFLRGKNYSDSEIEKTGLIIRNPKSEIRNPYYDRFRSRIMFPINDSSGRTVAFGGRIFNNSIPTPDLLRQSSGGVGVQYPKSEPAKYINSPQTILYDKSNILYGFDKAKLEISRIGLCALVEGYMDAVMSYQAGVKNAVAISGTALTPQHINIISRLAKKVVAGFDADQAGITATGRSVNLLLSSGFEVKIVKMGEKDPADLIKKSGAEVWREAIKNAKHIIDFYLGVLGERHKEDAPALCSEVKKTIFPYLALINNEMEKSFWIKEAARCAGIKEESVWQEFQKSKKTNFVKKFTPPLVKKEQSRKSYLEKRFLSLFSATYFHGSYEEEIKELVKQIKQETSMVLSDEFRVFLKFIESGETLDDKHKTLALEAELVYNLDIKEEICEEFGILFKELKKEDLRQKREYLAMEIKRLEEEIKLNKNGVSEEQLLKKIEEFNKLSKEFN